MNLYVVLKPAVAICRVKALFDTGYTTWESAIKYVFSHVTGNKIINMTFDISRTCNVKVSKFCCSILPVFYN